VQVAIAALHAKAQNYQQTDWPQIAGLYEVLLRISPSPVIELNHAAAISMVDGPLRALDLIDALEARGDLRGHELLQAVRADLLRRLNRRDAALEAYRAASAATQLKPLQRFYARRLAELNGGSFDQNALAAEATTGCVDKLDNSACNVDSVELSATPSTRSGRK
jgi:RNA polymerase sigma-70 factor (ECF subfamily)